eukprot:1157745-Pelagomonas_calceolata.AAC.8
MLGKDKATRKRALKKQSVCGSTVGRKGKRNQAEEHRIWSLVKVQKVQAHCAEGIWSFTPALHCKRRPETSRVTKAALTGAGYT